MICKICNSTINNNYTFCTHCGTRIIPNNSLLVERGVVPDSVFWDNGKINWGKTFCRVFDEEINNFRNDIDKITSKASYCLDEDDRPYSISSKNINNLKNSNRKLYYPEIGFIITSRQSFEMKADAYKLSYHFFRFTIESYSLCRFSLGEFYLTDSKGTRIDHYIYNIGESYNITPGRIEKYCVLLPQSFSPSEIFIVFKYTNTVIYENVSKKKRDYVKVYINDSFPRFLARDEAALFQIIKETIKEKDWSSMRITTEDILSCIQLYPSDSFTKLKKHIEEAVNVKQRPKVTTGKGTSLPEQELLFYIKQFFPDAISRMKLNSIEVDIYIESINVAIEYDGAYWHKTKYEADCRKNRFLSNKWIYTIRIREEGLPILPPFFGCVYRVKHRVDGIGLFMNEIITATIHELAAFVNNTDIRNQMSEFSLSYSELLEDDPLILSEIYDRPISKELNSSFIEEYWDYTRNGNLKPENTPYNIRNNVWLICSEGISALRPIVFKSDKLCPFSKDCEIGCKYMYDQVFYYLNNPDRFHARNYANEINNWLTNSINTAFLELIQLRIHNKLNKTQMFNFDNLFFSGFHDEEATTNSIYLKKVVDPNLLNSIRALLELYPNAGVAHIMSARSFDTSYENRKQLIDYYKWCITTSRATNLSSIFPFVEYEYDRLSTEFVAMLIDMLNDKGVAKFINQEELNALLNKEFYYPTKKPNNDQQSTASINENHRNDNYL